MRDFLSIPTLATDMLKRWALIPVVENIGVFVGFYIFKLMYLGRQVCFTTCVVVHTDPNLKNR